MFGLFRKRSVDDVVDTFNQAIEDLKEVEQNNKEDAETARRKAVVYTTRATIADEEAKRASSVRGKIEAIIS